MTMITEAEIFANDEPRRALLVFDGECGFCRYWVNRWRGVTHGKIDYAPFQEVAHRHPQIPHAAFENAVQLIEPDGRVTGGADALFRALELAGRNPLWLRLLSRAPGVRALSRCGYRFVARHRMSFSLMTKWFFKSDSRGSDCALRRTFPKIGGALFLIFLIFLARKIFENRLRR